MTDAYTKKEDEREQLLAELAEFMQKHKIELLKSYDTALEDAERIKLLSAELEKLGKRTYQRPFISDFQDLRPAMVRSDCGIVTEVGYETKERAELYRQSEWYATYRAVLCTHLKLEQGPSDARELAAIEADHIHGKL